MKEHWLRIESEYIVVIIPTLMNNLKLHISEMAAMAPKLVLLVADMISVFSSSFQEHCTSYKLGSILYYGNHSFIFRLEHL